MLSYVYIPTYTCIEMSRVSVQINNVYYISFMHFTARYIYIVIVIDSISDVTSGGRDLCILFAHRATGDVIYIFQRAAE